MFVIVLTMNHRGSAGGELPAGTAGCTNPFLEFLELAEPDVNIDSLVFFGLQSNPKCYY